MDPEAMKDKAAEMLTEIEAFRHSVVLVDAPEPRHAGHKIRVAESTSPAWYSRLCSEHQSLRGRGPKRYKRPRTYIKRDLVVAELERIATTGRPSGGVYGDRVGRLVRSAIEAERKSAVTPPAAMSAAEFMF
jgi:hypothetical protein